MTSRSQFGEKVNTTIGLGFETRKLDVNLLGIIRKGEEIFGDHIARDK